MPLNKETKPKQTTDISSDKEERLQMGATRHYNEIEISREKYNLF